MTDQVMRHQILTAATLLSLILPPALLCQAAGDPTALPQLAGKWRVSGAFLPGGTHILNLRQDGDVLSGTFQINARCYRPFGTSVWEETVQGNVTDTTMFFVGTSIRQTQGDCPDRYGLHKFSGRISGDRKRIDGTATLEDRREQRWSLVR